MNATTANNLPNRDANTNHEILVRNLVSGWDAAKPICKVDTMQIMPGRISVLCGPNGVGKSTLLKTLASQIAPISGELRIDGENIAEMSRRSIAKKLAYVAQFNESRKSMTVEEWVMMGRNPHQDWWSWSLSKSDQDKVEQALERTSCISLRKKFVDNLSGGERQRVAIATALAQEPTYILLDEPTAHLDFRHQLELLDLLAQLRSEGLGILLVMHDLNLTARIADTVLLFHQEMNEPSKIIASGTVDAVLTHDNLLKVYGVNVNIINQDGIVSFVPIRASQH